jgi:hypothetical protein
MKKIGYEGCLYKGFEPGAVKQFHFISIPLKASRTFLHAGLSGRIAEEDNTPVVPPR